MSSYIHTYSGKKFYPLDPRIEDIDINDIAHALSLMTRANGHYKYFYSVGQHSINCYREAVARGYSRDVQLACLLHDGSEAYLSDITRPVKGHLDKYKLIEKNLQDIIYKKYLNRVLNDEEKYIVKLIDDCILHFEFIELMGIRRDEGEYEKYSDPDLRERKFKEVQDEFLDIFNSFNINL